MKRSLNFWIALVILIPGFAEAGEQTKKPNVVIVLTDDQGYGDLSCHGNELLLTPNLDAFHAQSVRMTDFHVSPVCTPTRASIMTGKDAVGIGAWGTTYGRSIPRKGYLTMAEIFQKAGYKTGIFGKWHLGDNYPYRPEDRGFEEVLRHGGGGVGQVPDYWGNNYFDDTYFHNGKAEKQEGYCTDVWFNNAMNFIEKNKDNPFFCYLPTNAPHSPFLVSDAYKKLYEGNPLVPHVEFYGMITNIDDNMGRLRAKLKELNLEDNTILIFMSDNGTARGFIDGIGHNAGMKGTKGSTYEGGHRVPFFIRWPAKGLKGGRDIEELAAHIDLLPTLIDLCGLKKPSNVKFDGISLVPLLLEGAVELRPRSIVTQFSQSSTSPTKWDSAVLRKKWRLVGGNELFDISKDPGQENDVAKIHPEIVASMRADYENWWADVSAGFDVTSDILVGSDHENPVALTSFDWHLTNGRRIPWDQTHVVTGLEAHGFWALEVEHSGMYEIALRRWPEELEAPIASAIEGGNALPARFARIKIGDVEQTISIADDAAESVFKIPLVAGKTRLQTWFLDEKKNELCGAYYVSVKRK